MFGPANLALNKAALAPSFSDLTLELPFTLTHPKPKHRVISQMVTLPPRSSLSSIGDASKTSGEGKDQETTNTQQPLTAATGERSLSQVRAFSMSVKGIHCVNSTYMYMYMYIHVCVL